MPDVPRELAEHSLSVYKGAKTVKQSLRRFGTEKRRAIGKEIARLTAAKSIREVTHTDWVANPVLVPKKGTTEMRMCIDYTGLNKACPQRSVRLATNFPSHRFHGRLGAALFP